jgi:choline dehydrogenase
VGENLQDHLQFRLTFKCSKPITTNDELNSWWGRLRMGVQWMATRTGSLAIGINQGGCFMRVLPEHSPRPDIQFHVATLSADMAGAQPHKHSGFTFSVCQLRPESRGSIRLRGSDAYAHPEIQPNYLASAIDRQTAVAAVQAARRFANSKALAPYVLGEIKPGSQVNSDAEILDWCRGNGATIFHPSGTCAMGTGSQAVLDERLRVRGIEGLRVVDCSAMPLLVSGNTNAPVIMMAEKAADMIRADAKSA